MPYYAREGLSNMNCTSRLRFGLAVSLIAFAAAFYLDRPRRLRLKLKWSARAWRPRWRAGCCAAAGIAGCDHAADRAERSARWCMEDAWGRPGAWRGGESGRVRLADDQAIAEAPNDAVWFRQTYVVPETLDGYDLTGSRIWFQFHADANGPMPEILYFNGRRVALGDDLEPVVLFDRAKPGDKVTVAIKLLHTVDTKNFRGATLNIEFPENRPNPEDLREEFLSAALLVPSLAPGNDAGQIEMLNGRLPRWIWQGAGCARSGEV